MSKPGETDYGKGSFPRTFSTPTFRNNFEQINWTRNCTVCLQPKPCPHEQFFKRKHEHKQTSNP